MTDYLKRLEESAIRVGNKIKNMTTEDFERRMNNKRSHWSSGFLSQFDYDSRIIKDKNTV